jgi:hypothetical protein
MHKNKSRLNSEKAFYHLFPNPLSCCLLYKNLKNKTLRTVILYLVLSRCKSWSLTFREDILRVFKNRVLRRMF